MGNILREYGRRFCSDVPVWVAKLQILLGVAAGSLGSMAGISWPGKTAVIGEFCGYGAAGCVGFGVFIQFVERAVEVIEKPTSEQAPEVKLAA